MSSKSAANPTYTRVASITGIKHTLKWKCPEHNFDIWVTIPHNCSVWVPIPYSHEEFSQVTLPVWDCISLITWCCAGGTHGEPPPGTSLPDDATAPSDYMSRIRAAQPALQSFVRGIDVPTKDIPSIDGSVEPYLALIINMGYKPEQPSHQHEIEFGITIESASHRHLLDDLSRVAVMQLQPQLGSQRTMWVDDVSSEAFSGQHAQLPFTFHQCSSYGEKFCGCACKGNGQWGG